MCVKNFPKINMVRKDALDKSHLRDIGVFVCRIGWNSDTQNSEIQILE